MGTCIPGIAGPNRCPIVHADRDADARLQRQLGRIPHSREDCGRSTATGRSTSSSRCRRCACAAAGIAADSPSSPEPAARGRAPARSCALGSYQADSYSLRIPRLNVILRLSFQSSWKYMPQNFVCGSGAGPPIICDEPSSAPSRNVAHRSPLCSVSGLLNVSAVSPVWKLKFVVLKRKMTP